ncbi:MAG: CDP-diacylglycerol--glycerol-3-phosphate 3-phosphatidyltransferase [Pseudomonadales bacterium]|nr:CDP-diacylglycerol--glycerol-3-phosphate 3-phosphatidyltransferase [Pseudomonadales bacterium]MEE2892143.1 CDP-diacylglycerol--glycerol-3-phosphate 3-phosphatidyltransferase [Pseudomonadota bacterium]
MNLANLLTSFRIVLVPVFVLLFMLPSDWTRLATATVFALAAVTDWIDGYVARSRGETSRFGAFLDPVADKLIVGAALVMMAGAHANLWFSAAAVVIVGREIIISALREWMADMQRRGVVSVSWVGKVKTVFQMVAILVLLALPAELDLLWVKLGYGLLYVAAALTLWSMVIYIQAAWPTLREAYEEAAPDR